MAESPKEFRVRMEGGPRCVLQSMVDGPRSLESRWSKMADLNTRETKVEGGQRDSLS